jgi:DNA-binding LacI/PurR family transcriptional regulator
LQEDDRKSQPRVIAERFVDGLIVETGLPPQLEQAVAHYRIPTTWLNSDHHDACDCVYPDEVHSGRCATEHLMTLGHREILFIAPPTQFRKDWHFSAFDRQLGYEQALAADAFKRHVINEGDLHRTDLDAAVKLIMESRKTSNAITGVVAHGIGSAIKLRYDLQAAGVNCPHDISIITADDLHILRRTWPELAGISCDRYQMGRSAAEMMLAKISSGHPQPSQVFHGKLIEGDTVAPARPRKRVAKR